MAIRQGNALIRSKFGVNPNDLEFEEWQDLREDALWLIDYESSKMIEKLAMSMSQESS